MSEKIDPALLSAAVRGPQKTVLQAVINAVPAPIFFKDSEGRYLGCNRAFENYIGLSREELVGKSVHELFDDDLASVYAEADAALFADGGEQVYEALVKYADGSIRDVMFHKAVFDAEDEGVSGLVGVILDITDRKKMEVEYRELALVDSLTSVDNRFSFLRSAESALALMARSGNPVSLMLLDIDDFKGINDSHGHGVGDSVLTEIASRLRRATRKTDTVARLGGDEFAILIQDPAQAESVAALAAKIIDSNTRPIAAGDAAVRTSVSIGIAIAPDHADDIESLLKCADKALYRAKSRGKNCFQVFDRSDED